MASLSVMWGQAFVRPRPISSSLWTARSSQPRASPQFDQVANMFLTLTNFTAFGFQPAALGCNCSFLVLWVIGKAFGSCTVVRISAWRQRCLTLLCTTYLFCEVHSRGTPRGRWPCFCSVIRPTSWGASWFTFLVNQSSYFRSRQVVPFFKSTVSCDDKRFDFD